MQLHRGQKKALSDLLGAVQIQAGRNVELADWALFTAFRDQILKAKPWKELIGPSDFGNIVWSVIHSALRAEGGIAQDYVGTLATPDLDKLRQSIERDITAAFESLPLDYDVYIPLAGFAELGAPALPISSDVALVDAAFDDALAHRLNSVHPKPWGGLLGIFSGEAKPTINDAVRCRYLHIRRSGYASYSADSPAVRAAIAKAKHFVALCFQSGVIVESERWAAKWVDKPDEERPWALVLARDTERGFRIEVPYELMDYFYRLRLDASKIRVREPILAGGNEREPNTPEEWAGAILSSLERVRGFLSIESELKDGDRIRAAMEWQVDAASTHNESIAFLQRCIALEALLGSDESQRNVTERLSDRYAYLLGRTESQRSRHREIFRMMYGHRSDIVHGRAGQLSDEHRRAGMYATEMLEAVLVKETNNLLSWALSRPKKS